MINKVLRLEPMGLIIDIKNSIILNCINVQMSVILERFHCTLAPSTDLQTDGRPLFVPIIVTEYGGFLLQYVDVCIDLSGISLAY